MESKNKLISNRKFTSFPEIQHAGLLVFISVPEIIYYSIVLVIKLIHIWNANGKKT